MLNIQFVLFIPEEENMRMIAYIREIKRKLRDEYGFKPLPGSTKEEPLLDVPDGGYSMIIEGKTNAVRIVNGKISCWIFKKEDKMNSLRPEHFVNGFILFLFFGLVFIVDHIYFVATFLFGFSAVCLLCAICDFLEKRSEAKAYERHYKKYEGSSFLQQY